MLGYMYIYTAQNPYVCVYFSVFERAWMLQIATYYNSIVIGGFLTVDEDGRVFTDKCPI
jgi:hypothetical protein